MHPDRWARIEQLLDAMFDLPPHERLVFLERECPDDPDLRTEVLRILEAGEAPTPLLDRPVARVATAFDDASGDTPVPVPERVGPYRIERVIGEGGMGMVFLAHRDDGEFDQRVALKLVRRGLHLDARVVRRFREERQILAALSHPGIARLLDGGIAEDGLPFFAMEYVEGESITKYCEGRSLGIDERLALFVRVCDALAHAHAKHIVHRDVKPSNILVTAEGHPRLLDFGIAKLIAPDGGTSGAALTRRSERLLTPEYASPEQIRGEPVGVAADVYGLGVLLYELLTGQRPFRRAERTAHELERAVLEEEPTRPSEAVPKEPLRRRLKGDLDAIVLTAMSKEPERRYGGAQELGADVRRHLDGLPVAAHSASPAYRIRRWVRRHRVAVQSGAAGALLMAILAMMATRDRSPDRLLRSLRLSGPQQVTNDEGLELDPAISPDGEQVAYAAGIEGSMRIFVRGRDGSRAAAVGATLGGGDHRRPRWSRDGTHLLFQANRGIWLIPARGGEPSLVVAAPGDTATAHSPTQSPDGKAIAWVVRDTVYERPFAGGQAHVLATLPVPHSLAWSPDGRSIAAVSGNAEFVYQRLGNLGPSALYLLPTSCPPPTGASCAPLLLAPPTSLNTSPEWLDASRLVFVSSRGGARDLFVMRVDGARPAAGEAVRLTAGQQMHTVSVAANGRELAYSVFRQSSNIWSLDISSGRRRLDDARRVTSGRQTIEGMSISPNGQSLAFDANRSGQQDIYVVPAAGGEPELVVATPEDKFHVAWSPDGKSLAFHTFRDGIRRAATSPAHGGPVRLLNPNGLVREEHTPTWMPDGRGFVYWRTFPEGTELFALRRTGDSTWSERQLTRHGGFWASFTADGTRMAYITPLGFVLVMGPDLDEASSRVVHAPPPPGKDGIRVQNGVISPDGAAFIAKGEDGVGPGFWRLPIAGGAPALLLRLNDPRRTSPRPEFASDGRRLFFLLTEREADIWAVRLEAP